MCQSQEPYTVTLHKIDHYLCSECGSQIDPDVDIPEHGDLGKNLLPLVTIWSEARLSRRIGGILKAVYGLDLSACIYGALLNVSGSLQPFVDGVREEVSSSDSAGFDIDACQWK